MFTNKPGYEALAHWYALIFPVVLVVAGAFCIFSAFRQERKKADGQLNSTATAQPGPENSVNSANPENVDKVEAVQETTDNLI